METYIEFTFLNEIMLNKLDRTFLNSKYAFKFIGLFFCNFTNTYKNK